MVREVDVHELAEAHNQGAFVLDVREPEEYERARVPGARLMPLASLPSGLASLPDDETIYVICASGGRSYQAAQFLSSRGLDAVSVAGGTMGWLRAGHPVESGDAESAA